MAYFPFMMQIRGRKALVVGAGQAAKYKVRSLAGFGADVTVVAPVISADILKQGKDIKIIRRVYKPGEAMDYDIVVAATDSKAINDQVLHDAKRGNAMCAVASDPLSGDFIFPAIIKKRNYSVAVSTDGKSPLIAKKVKEAVEERLPEDADELAARLGEVRESVKASDGTPEEHKARLADLAGMQAEMPLGDGPQFASQAASGEEAPESKPEPVEMPDGVIRVGSRESKLAQVQTDKVIDMLERAGYKCEKVLFKTTGDKMLDKPLQDFGGKAVFVTEIEDAMLEGKIDIAVHSAKDLPAELADGLAISACLEREDVRDMLVTRRGTDKKDIRVLGTSSRRRKVQMQRYLVDGELRDLRGNVPTRIEKLKAGEYDAIILAAAGIKRLGLRQDPELHYEYIAVDKSLPAAGQGIIAVETRDSGNVKDIIAKLNNEEAMTQLTVERGFMQKIGADCHEAVAAYSMITGGTIMMKVMKYINGRCVYFAGASPLEKKEELAESLGERILSAER